jgi:hypothetical protein
MCEARAVPERIAVNRNVMIPFIRNFLFDPKNVCDSPP